MTALLGIFSIVPGWVWALITAGAMATSCVQTTRLSVEKSSIAAERLEYARAALKAVEAAQAETIRLQGVKDEAIRKQTARANANKVAAAAAATERDSLRDELAAASAKLPSLSHQACLARADALSGVFDQCAGAASRMAEKADRHANDAMTLDEAWPTSP
jgi:hypothetical protein